MASTPSSGRCLAHGPHAAPDDAQRVDVEARVGLVEHGDERLEQRHLQDLVALLLAAAEALVEVAAGEGGVHAEALHPLGHEHADLEDRDLVGALARRHGLAQELGDRHALDRLGVLEGQEDARPWPARRSAQRGDVLAVEQDGARRSPCRPGAPCSAPASVDLPAPLGPMRAWISPAPDGQVDAAQDGAVLGRHVEVPDLEQRGGRSSSLKAYRFGQVFRHGPPRRPAGLRCGGPHQPRSTHSCR